MTTDAINPAGSPALLRIGAWAALAGYALLLLTLTHLPKPPGMFEGQNDKTLHLLAYLALGSFAYVAAALQFPKRNGIAIWVVLIGVLFAAVDEATQPIFGRYADVLDWRSDVLGLIVAVCAMACTREVLRRLRAR